MKKRRNYLRNFYLTLFTLLTTLLTTNLHAADNLKTISGTVRDAKTSEPIIGATVFIRETQDGTVTDVNGQFSVSIAEGNYTIDIEYLSYKSVTIDINTAQTSNPLEIGLESDNVQIKDIVVSTRRRSDTETAMVATVKNIPQVVSGISAVQIAKSPDRTASEVVRRIPGITIIDDRFIIVRGLSQRYNNAWINGLAVPSTETDSRAFSFDIIPSSQIDNLLVYKSPSPEIPGDFSGGFVQITTKSIPDENSMEISYNTGFNVKTQFEKFRYNPGSKTDFLGFDINKRPLRKDFPSHMGSVTNPDKITQLTQNGFNNDWRILSKVPLPDQRFSFVITRRMETKNGATIGNITAVNYTNTFKTLLDIQNSRYGIYSATSDRPIYLDNYKDNQYTNDVRLGAMHNWSFKINNRNRIEFKNILNILGRNRLTERTGIKDISSMYYLEETEMLYSSRLTYSGQLSGIHTFDTPTTKLDWNVGYSYANRSEPDRRIVTNLAGIGSEEDIPNVTLQNDKIKRYFQKLHDNIVSASVNYKKALGQGAIIPTLKVGAYAEYRDRDYNPREFIYRYDKLPYSEKEDYIKLPFQEMLDNKYLGADKVYIDEITNKTHAYSATVNQQAIYGALDIPWGKLNIYAGVRIENYDLKLMRDESISPTVVINNTKHHRTFDVLPSANITYKFNDKHQLRAAYGRSLNRPELREVSPAVYFDFDLFSEIGGNENLKTAYIHNVDLRYEFYPARGEVLSIGVFYKHFKNPIEWTYIDMGGTLRYSYENALSADNMGIELDIRKNLEFLGARNLSLVLNAALIKSNVQFNKDQLLVQPDRPMQGQSPYVINAGLFYQSDRLGMNMSLLYNRIGKRIIGIGKTNSVNNDISSMIPDSYEMPRNTLDFTFSKSLGKKVDLKFTLKDILSEDVVYKQFPKFEKDGKIQEREQITRRYNPGQSFLIGVSIKL